MDAGAQYFPESHRLSDYLASTDVIDADNHAVQATAARLAGGGDDATQACRLFQFVRDEVPHTNDVGGVAVTCRASDVLAQRTGICYAKSHLLAALLRAVGIPAGFCYQRLEKNPPHAGFELHGFNGVYLASLGRWVRVDARGNKPGVDAQFNVEQDQLAFPTDAAKGELTYPTIFVAPAACVLRALTSYARLDELWPELPGEIS